HMAGNNPAILFPQHQCIHELIEEQVTKTPDVIALVFEDKQLTYAELNIQANQLAHYLMELGVKPDTRVAICVEHNLNLVIGLIAILKAGSAYVPLDPSYPIDRISTMLKDSEPLVLLTQKSLEALFTDIPIAKIYLDSQPCLWANQPNTNLNCHDIGLTPQHLAYIIYTSGSTGKPKGAMIEHRNIVNFLVATAKTPGLNSSDTVLAFTTIAFDIASSELLLPLIKGAKIILINRANAVNPTFLQNIIHQFDITMMQATPTRWRLLTSSGWQGSKRLKALCGGEGLSVKFSAELTQYVGELWNMYGPTETTVATSCLRIDDKRPILQTYESIGRPIDNTQIYILDEHLQPVPINVTGELYIGGAGVGRGYWKRPELTQERFIKNPFNTEIDTKLYKTGDLARWLDDGNIEFLGRNDFQVKVRGYRIELGEIEAKLEKHTAVLKAAVIAKEDHNGENKLIAYLTLKNGFHLNVSELRNFLKQKIPIFMIPSAFVILDNLPITTNGKIDRNALPEPDYQQYSHDEFVAPHNSIEKQLTEIWCNTLDINQIGIHDNFFDLGGHSLLVVKLVLEINKYFNINLPFGIIYQFPTIETLSHIITSGDLSSAWYSLVPIQTQGTRPPLFAIHTISLSDLPRYLGKDQPLYFIRYGMATERHDSSVSLPALEDLAKHYIQEMQHIQPQGPYYLIGFSFGGILAYEMAYQLTANGQQVNFIGLLDTYLEREKIPQSLKQILYKSLNQTPI
ncbi:hypothetical protein DOJK_00253, partial [Patescibacteria group bacterium]